MSCASPAPTAAPPLELPAFVQPGQHDAAVAIALGYGRAGTDRFASVGPPWFEARALTGLVGVNAAALVTRDGRHARQYSGRAVTVAKTGPRAAAGVDAGPSLARAAGQHRAASDRSRKRRWSDAGGAAGRGRARPRGRRRRGRSLA